MKLTGLLISASTALASSISLPAYPLAVKTPYLHSWLSYSDSNNVTAAKPFFWSGPSLTWQILGRVNEDAYCLFGCAAASLTPATQTGISFTSTHTTITLVAGTTIFTLDFFSPVSLTDYVRQSIPYSYLTVKTQNAPSRSTIDVLVAIDDSWTAQAPLTQVEFLKTRGGSDVFILSGTNPYTWAEKSNRAAWGEVVLAAKDHVGHTSYQIGSTAEVASQFQANGILTGNTTGYASGDLVALAYHLANPSKCSPGTSVTFALGVQQENALNWLGEPQTGYYQATIKGTDNVVDHFFNDYTAAKIEGLALDRQIVDLGTRISTNYSDILESSIRQIWGGFQILIPLESKDTSKAKAWIKEISTDGNVQTVADLLPKALPAFYILAPDVLRLFLEPLVEYSLTWPAEFAFHDLGKNYPNATGETVASQEALIVDQTAVFIWMVYAYQRASGNTEWAKPYLPVIQKYADYLVNNGLYVASQSSSVDSIGPTANQTVLAMYAAIALTAHGALTGQANYTAVGRHFADVILRDGVDSQRTHITAHFGDADAVWISTYPLAFDQLLGLETFNATTRAMQSDWYAAQLHAYGMPFFSGVKYAVSDFMSWCAASSSLPVRDALLDGIHAFLTNGLNNVPGPTRWFVTGPNEGKYQNAYAKSTPGAYFIILAVNLGLL